MALSDKKFSDRKYEKMKEENEVFAGRLNDLCVNSGQKQSVIAEAVDVHINSLTAYIAGSKSPSYLVIKKLADYFNVTTDFLVGRSDNKTAKTEVIGEYLPVSDEAILSLLGLNLTEGAINEIKYHRNQPNKKRFNTLNRLLETGVYGIHPLINQICVYEEACKIAKDFACKQDHSPSKKVQAILDQGWVDGEFTLLKIEEYSEFLLAQLQNDFGNLIRKEFGWDRNREEEKANGSEA